MFIKYVILKNFRNYKDICIEFNKNFNIFLGDNAQGKTNILESIFMCATSRSHRTSKDEELINFDENTYYIKIVFEKYNREYSINISYSKNIGKMAKVNDIQVKK